MSMTYKVLSAVLSYPTADLQDAARDLIRALNVEQLLPAKHRAAIGALIEDIAEGKAGLKPPDTGQAGEFILVNASVVLNAGNADDDHVVELSGHQVATDDTAGAAHGGLECAKDRGGLALKGDANVDSDAASEEAIVDNSLVAANGSGSLQCEDAARGGRGGKADGLADFEVGGAATALDEVENGGVKFVEVWGLRRKSGLRQRLRRWLPTCTFRSHKGDLTRNLHTMEALCAVG